MRNRQDNKFKFFQLLTVADPTAKAQMSVTDVAKTATPECLKACEIFSGTVRWSGLDPPTFSQL